MKKMGSVVAALALTALLATAGFAQNVTAGAKAGIDFADLGGDIEDIIETETDLKTGFSVGGFLGVDLHRLFRLQGEVQYVQKGAKASEAGIEAKFKISYVEVLVPLTVTIPVEGIVVPRLYAGPSLAFELDCKIEQSDATVSVEDDCADVDAPTNSVDYGVFFGGGIDIQAGPGHITLDVLYNLGIGDIADEDPTDPVVDVSNKNIQVLAGYGFRIGA